MMRCCALSCSVVSDCVVPWTISHQLLSLWNLPCKNIGAGCHFILHGIFPGIEPASLVTPASAGGFFTTSTTWEAPCTWCYVSRYVYICTYVCMCGYIWWCMVEARKKGSFLKPVGYSNCFTNHLVDNGALLLLNSNRRVNNQLRSKRSLFSFDIFLSCHKCLFE